MHEYLSVDTHFLRITPKAQHHALRNEYDESVYMATRASTRLLRPRYSKSTKKGGFIKRDLVLSNLNPNLGPLRIGLVRCKTNVPKPGRASLVNTRTTGSKEDCRRPA